MDKKLLEIFESIKKENNDFIRKGQDIRPKWQCWQWW